jgi:hypothetical protein
MNREKSEEILNGLLLKLKVDFLIQLNFALETEKNIALL